jgi:chromosome segregation ATPase
MASIYDYEIRAPRQDTDKIKEDIRELEQRLKIRRLELECAKIANNISLARYQELETVSDCFRSTALLPVVAIISEIVPALSQARLDTLHDYYGQMAALTRRIQELQEELEEAIRHIKELREQSDAPSTRL